MNSEIYGQLFYMWSVIQKEEIDETKDVLINIVAKMIVTRGWTQIVNMETK